MQGSVYVEYTGIGGTNMDMGIMPADLKGSTEPGVVENEEGTTVNLIWSFPGGIQNQTPGGVGWGYALVPMERCNDDDIRAWLRGERLDARIQPIMTFNDDEIIEASNPAIAEEINNLMKKYLIAVMDNGDYTKLRDNYVGCLVRGA